MARWRRTLHGAADLALTLGAFLGALCILATLAGALFGIRPVIFQSGSMSPTIPAGSLALAKEAPAKELRVGDVVSVRVGDIWVSHRIVDVTHHEHTATLQLRGDANGRPDDRAYEVAAAARMLVSVPEAGRVVAWLSRVPGIFVLAGYAAIFLALVLRRSAASGGTPKMPAGPSECDDQRKARARDAPGKHRSRQTLRMASAATLSGLTLATSGPAWAAFGDAAPVSGSTVATSTVPAPDAFTCGQLGVLSVTFNWTAVAGATSYTLHYGPGGSQTTTVTGTTATVVSAISGGTAWVQTNRNFGSTTWTSAPSPARTYTVAVVSLCS